MAGRGTAASQEFDLALIDVLLPDASGFVLAEFAANQNVPVLLMSGHPHAAMRMEALDFACLQKPFSLVELTLAMGREIAASDANIGRIRGGMVRLNENVEGLADVTAISKSLIARSRGLLAKAVAQRSPLTRG